MKKALVFLLLFALLAPSAAFASEIDLSAMSYAELTTLKMMLNVEMSSRSWASDWQPLKTEDFSDSDTVVNGFAEKITTKDGVYYKLSTGRHIIGDMVPFGTYDVRLNEDNPKGFCRITYSSAVDENGLPDMNNYFAYIITIQAEWSFAFSHPVITVYNDGYLMIEGCDCLLYPVKPGY